MTSSTESARPVPLRQAFPEGARFRVTKPGARLSGMEPFAPSAYRGWGRNLEVGEVIEVARVAPGWGSDPGPAIVQWRQEGVAFVEFRPQVGTFWSPRPDDSYLERVD